MRLVKKVSALVVLAGAAALVMGCQVQGTKPEMADSVSDSGVHTFMLDNGMKILVQPDHRSQWPCHKSGTKWVALMSMRV